MIVCQGGNIGGYGLFIKDAKAHCVHNYVGAQELHVGAKSEVPEGTCELRYEFELTGKPDLKEAKGAGSRAALHQRQTRWSRRLFRHHSPRARHRRRLDRRPQPWLSGIGKVSSAVPIYRQDLPSDRGRVRQDDSRHRGGDEGFRQGGDGTTVIVARSVFEIRRRNNLCH
jgi:hypothetical protein